MNPKPAKAKETSTEQSQNEATAEPLVKREAIKKTSKKPATATPDKATNTKEAVDEPVKKIKDPVKKRKNLKEKVIRDSFSFPEQDYLKISALKKACLAEGIHVKKSELLRAGLRLLQQLSMTELKQVIEEVEKVKTGRPNTSDIS